LYMAWGPRNTEIDQFDHAFAIDKDVSRVYISMRNGRIQGVKVRDREEKLIN
jgi:hypothetical protein